MKLLPTFAFLLFCSCSSYESYFSLYGQHEEVCDDQDSWRLYVAPQADTLRLTIRCQATAGRLEWTLTNPLGQVVSTGSCEVELSNSFDWPHPVPGDWTLEWTATGFVGTYQMDLRADD